MISDAVKEEVGSKISKKEVRLVLRRELGLSYRKTKKLHPQANSIKVRVLRQ